MFDRDSRWDGSTETYREFMLRFSGAIESCPSVLGQIMNDQITPEQISNHFDRNEYKRLSKIGAALLRKYVPVNVMSELLNECKDD